MTEIKFANGSKIQFIEPEKKYYIAARGCCKSRMIMQMLIDSFELKWHQKLRLKIRMWLYDQGIL